MIWPIAAVWVAAALIYAVGIYRRRRHVAVPVSTCDPGWHDYGPWSDAYLAYETGVWWKGHRCQRHDCRAGQWKRAE